MEVIAFTYQDVHELLSNTYILKHNDECIVIDPSANSDGITNYINNHNLKLKGILLTHSHFDHMQGVDRLVNMFHAPLFVHELDEPGLLDTTSNCSIYNKKGVMVKIYSKAITVVDEEIINVIDGVNIKVIHTPFHTCGSVCYFITNENIIFSGDTLFKLTVGRSDLPTSEPRKQTPSLKKLMRLPLNSKIYPGHGPSSTLEYEIKYNKFIKQC